MQWPPRVFGPFRFFLIVSIQCEIKSVEQLQTRTGKCHSVLHRVSENQETKNILAPVHQNESLVNNYLPDVSAFHCVMIIGFYIGQEPAYQQESVQNR